MLEEEIPGVGSVSSSAQKAYPLPAADFPRSNGESRPSGSTGESLGDSVNISPMGMKAASGSNPLQQNEAIPSLSQDSFPPIAMDKNIPDFMQAQYMDEINRYLKLVPPEDRQAIRQINVGTDKPTETIQVKQNGQNYGDIYLNVSDLQDHGRVKYVVLHETGHAVAIHDGTLNGQTAFDWRATVNTGARYPDALANPITSHEQKIGDDVSQIDPIAETFADDYAAYYSGNEKARSGLSPEQLMDFGNKRYQQGGDSSLTRKYYPAGQGIVLVDDQGGPGTPYSPGALTKLPAGNNDL